MDLPFRIAVAAYARGTHHKLAFLALQRLVGADRVRWQRLFLTHAQAYASASKKPDDAFKDFKNHVLHPRDGYWGGAVAASRQWYATLVRQLKARAWPEAVEAAGILSHYLSDPLQPFHTGQSEAENEIHRACEWSINRSFDALYAAGTAAQPTYVRRLGRDPNWLARLVCESAELANRHYEDLIAHYCMARGVVDPPAGLDEHSRAVCSNLLVIAAATIAAVLDAAFDEAGVAPPEVAMTAPSLLALINIPRNQLLKRFENAEERRAVEAIYDELRTTGSVVAALPEESRTIRDLYATEVDANRTSVAVATIYALPAKTVTYELPQSFRAKPARATPDVAAPPTASHTVVPETSDGPAVPRSPRSLSVDDDVVDAPSIGPKTAQRLGEHGVKTIGQLLAADVTALSTAIGQRHITASTLRDWQAQAGLVLAIPGLTGGAAQLFVGAGYRTAAAIAAADSATLCTDVVAFARSTEGQRVLRDGAVPDAAKIAQWQARAITVRAA
jgi:predicted flap endonuclease-1-like 5' DNA nuclease